MIVVTPVTPFNVSVSEIGLKFASRPLINMFAKVSSDAEELANVNVDALVMYVYVVAFSQTGIFVFPTAD